MAKNRVKKMRKEGWFVIAVTSDSRVAGTFLPSPLFFPFDFRAVRRPFRATPVSSCLVPALCLVIVSV